MKILVIAKRPPWPIHYGDRLHCYELVRRLARRHEVLLVAQKPSEVSDWAFNFECRVGRGESLQLARYRSLPGVDWVDYVPDPRPLIAQSAVVVVPMLSGAGIKNKVMEAWALGKTVVYRSRALGSLPGRHAENVWIANTAKNTARPVLTLANDQPLRARIGEPARRTAAEHCSWDRAAADLEQLCLDLTLEQPLRYDVNLAPASVPASAPAHARRQAEGKKGVVSKHGA